MNSKILMFFLLLLSAITINAAENTSTEVTQKLTIAAAADLNFAMKELVKQFETTHPNSQVEIILGSSGNAFTQIQNGAPFDMFFSADISYPEKLKSVNLVASEVTLYAIGRIVLWSTKVDASKMKLQDLADPSIQKVAIAAPDHAPYGKRAKEAMEHEKVWEAVSKKLVFGENISQAAQFAYSGAADIAVIALSLAVSQQFQNKVKGGYYLIPENWHAPLEQAYVILKHGENNPLAQQFAKFVATPQARQIFEKYGFILPK